ncbi:exported hypothetical protein [Candidatus Terasakiella magnetica]|uniref:Type II/III secretion system secretin-like domain-containing protein n=1 Tax=Candidatus Terasakiella magnetica TaxID=1867952 RepID=A0A1C3RL99_9PROT|nr:hypothetical protein [Candidatus Terasakiella magnetica]SCA58090.1 exported hypothetical protein [Candidatus Terasakiella magnetica]
MVAPVWRKLFLSSSLMVLMAACSTREPLKADFPDAPEKPTFEEKQSMLGMAEEPVVEIFLPENSLVPLVNNDSDPLPDITISNLNHNGTALDLFRAIAAKAGMPFAVQGSIALTEENSKGRDEIKEDRFPIENYSGSLFDILEAASTITGLFWQYKHKMLKVSKTRRFNVYVPPVQASKDAKGNLSSEIKTHMTDLGAQKVIYNNNSMLSFRANRFVYDEIAAYLKEVTENLSVVVADIHIWEVALSDDNKRGLDFQQLNYQATKLGASLSGGAQVTGGAIAGLTYAGGRFTLNLLASLLNEQGTLQTVTKPIVPVRSGQRTQFSVGKETPYLSEVGAVAVGDSPQTTSKIDFLQTGTTIDVAANYINGLVYLDINLSDTAATAPLSITQNGQTSTQYETSKNKIVINTPILPGHTHLQGGLIRSKDQRISKGIPLGSSHMIPSDDQTLIERSEYVIAVTTRVLKYRVAPSQTSLPPVVYQRPVQQPQPQVQQRTPQRAITPQRQQRQAPHLWQKRQSNKRQQQPYPLFEYEKSAPLQPRPAPTKSVESYELPPFPSPRGEGLERQNGIEQKIEAEGFYHVTPKVQNISFSPATSSMFRRVKRIKKTPPKSYNEGVMKAVAIKLCGSVKPACVNMEMERMKALITQTSMEEISL